MSLDQAQIAEFFARPIAVDGNALLRDPQRLGYRAAVDFFAAGGGRGRPGLSRAISLPTLVLTQAGSPPLRSRRKKPSMCSARPRPWSSSTAGTSRP